MQMDWAATMFCNLISSLSVCATNPVLFAVLCVHLCGCLLSHCQPNIFICTVTPSSNSSQVYMQKPYFVFFDTYGCVLLLLDPIQNLVLYSYCFTRNSWWYHVSTHLPTRQLSFVFMKLFVGSLGPQFCSPGAQLRSECGGILFTSLALTSHALGTSTIYSYKFIIHDAQTLLRKCWSFLFFLDLPPCQTLRTAHS